MNVNASSGRTPARRASSSSTGRSRPRSRTSSSVTAPSSSRTGAAPLPAASRGGGSITMIVRRPGSWSLIAAIFASCSSFSHTIALASESESTHRHSSGGVGLIDRHDHCARGWSRPCPRRTTRDACWPGCRGARRAGRRGRSARGRSPGRSRPAPCSSRRARRRPACSALRCGLRARRPSAG